MCEDLFQPVESLMMLLLTQSNGFVRVFMFVTKSKTITQHYCVGLTEKRMEDGPSFRQQYLQGHALGEGIPRQAGIPRTAPLV